MEAQQLAAIPIVAALMMMVKQIPVFAPEGRKWILPWVSLAVGIGVACGLAGAMTGVWAMTPDLVIQGVICGLAASGLYDVGAKAIEKATGNL